MKELHKKTLQAVRDQACRTLSPLVKQALLDARETLVRESRYPALQDARSLERAQAQVLDLFVQTVRESFDSLLGQAATAPVVPDYGSLTLMNDDELESAIALEGMITHARNCDITEYLCFTTRLNDLFSCRVVDESNNPLDPAQLGEAIKTGVELARLSSQGTLTVYRQFNRAVFHNLEKVLAESNELMRQQGVLPELSVSGRNKEDIRTRRSNSRERTDPNERAFAVPTSLAAPKAAAQQDVFTLIQSLLHKDVHKVITSSNLYDSIEATDLLYRAIWDDVTVPESIRKLLGRTSLTTLKTTLSDKKFWDNPMHPVRTLLNVIAEARSRNCLSDEIDKDPLFQKARELADRFVAHSEDDLDIARKLLDEFNAFKQQLAAAGEVAAAKPLDGKEICRQRLEQAQASASRKIAERIRNERIPAEVRNLLERHLRNFLVEVLLAQGPGGDNWKPIMRTIDLLVWSVRPGKSGELRDKLQLMNDKLMVNLRKALRVVKLDNQEIETILAQVRQAQEDSFSIVSPVLPVEPVVGELLYELVREQAAPPAPASSQDAALPADERYLREARELPLGVWMEFVVDGTHRIRCTLAAKIEEPSNFIFVNRQGVRVIEKSVTGLAQELKAGTARQVSESVLVDRAIDTMIARLRARNESKARPAESLHTAA